MRVRNTVNHEFESQLERVESVARQGTAAATAPTALHGNGGGKAHRRRQYVAVKQPI